MKLTDVHNILESFNSKVEQLINNNKVYPEDKLQLIVMNEQLKSFYNTLPSVCRIFESIAEFESLRSSNAKYRSKKYDKYLYNVDYTNKKIIDALDDNLKLMFNYYNNIEFKDQVLKDFVKEIMDNLFDGSDSVGDFFLNRLEPTR